MKKIAIIGTGAVGSSAANAIITQNLASELLLHDIREEAANACCMDIQDALPLLGSRAKVRVCSLAECAGADIIVLAFTAKICANRREELAANCEQLRAMAPALQGFGGIVVVATNPNDAMVFHARRELNLPASRVIGTGTSLDSARLVARISRDLQLAPEDVSAAMLGEHGDSQLAHLSAATAAGAPLEQAYKIRSVAYEGAALQEATAYRGHEIFRLKGKTEYGIAAAIARICAAIVRNERASICVSFVQDGAVAISEEITLVIAGGGASVGDGCILGSPKDSGEVAYSRPAIVGAAGVLSVPALCASAAEFKALAASIEQIKTLCE